VAQHDGVQVDSILINQAEFGKAVRQVRASTMFVTRRALNPLHFFGRIAVVLFVLGMIPQVFFLVQWISGEGLHVRPIMLLGFVFIIVSLQIGSIGLLAEMISARSAREAVYAFKQYDLPGAAAPRQTAPPGAA
jgi:Zn-dependent membrane protease YugP